MNDAAGFIMDVPNSTYFAHTLRRAIAVAERHSHRLATPEHLLIALLDDPDAKDMLETARADIAMLRVKLNDVINHQMSALHAPGVELRPSLEFDRVLVAAADLASRSPRRERDGAFVLAALVWEPESPAANLLRQSGLTSETALAWLNAFRSSSSQPQAKGGPRLAPPSAPVKQAPSKPAIRPSEPPRGEAGRSEPSRAEPIRLDPARSEPPKPAPGRPEPIRLEPIRSELVRPEPVRPEPIRPDGVRPEPQRRDPPRPAPRQDASDKEEETLEEMLARVRSILDEDDSPAPAPEPRAADLPQRAADLPQRAAEPPAPSPRPTPPPLEAPLSPAASPRSFPPRPPEPQSAPAPGGHPSGAQAPGAAQALSPHAPGPHAPGPHAPGPHAPGSHAPGAHASGVHASGVHASGVHSWAPPPAPERPQPPLPFGGLPRSAAAAAAPMQPPAQAQPLPQPAAPAPSQPYRDPSAPPPLSPSRSLAPIVQPKPRSEMGKLVENIPRKMRAAEAERVEVRLSKADTGSLLQGFQGRGELTQHTVVLTRAMSVMLRAPDGGFLIENLSPETQWVVDRPSFIEIEPFGRWRWLVTPLRRGQHKLLLIVSARNVDENGMIGDTPLPDQIIEVSVQTNYRRNVRIFARWAGLMAAGGVLTEVMAWTMRLLLR